MFASGTVAALASLAFLRPDPTPGAPNTPQLAPCPPNTHLSSGSAASTGLRDCGPRWWPHEHGRSDAASRPQNELGPESVSSSESTVSKTSLIKTRGSGLGVVKPTQNAALPCALYWGFGLVP